MFYNTLSCYFSVKKINLNIEKKTDKTPNIKQNGHYQTQSVHNLI